MDKDLLNMMVRDSHITGQILTKDAIEQVKESTRGEVNGSIDAVKNGFIFEKQAAAATVIASLEALRASCAKLVSFYAPKDEVQGMDVFLELSSILHEEINKEIDGAEPTPPPLVA